MLPPPLDGWPRLRNPSAMVEMSKLRPLPGNPQTALIVGASGELGGALAEQYAHVGATLSLWGRNVPRLEATAARCRAHGAAVRIRSLDLADVDATIAALTEDDNLDRFSIAVFAAGIGDIREPGERVERPDLVTRAALVNFIAPAAMAACMAERMAERGNGNIILIGSAAAFHSLPFATAYTGSKTGLARFADGLRLAVRRYGVRVTLVAPGFINTAAARRVPGHLPYIMQPDEAARRIVKAAARGQGMLIMPWPFAALRLIDRALPRFLRDRVLLALTPPALRD